MSQDDFWESFAKSQGLPKYTQKKGEDYWSEESENMFIPEDALVVGEKKDSPTKAYIPLKAFETHIHIIGASGTGKTYFMEALMRDIITRGYGACLIDPHDQLYQNMVNYLAHFPELAEKVILFNPGQKGENYVGLNPLKKSHIFPELSTQVKYITSGAAKVWEEDSKKTPQLRRNMGNMLYPLIEGGWTLREAEAFVDLNDSAKRNALIRSTGRKRVLNDWQIFDKMSLSKKIDTLGSLQNRMPEFLDSKAVQYTIGRIKNVLDIEDIVENGKILLCNFSASKNFLSDDDAYLLGVLLINELTNYVTSCRTHEMAKERPFFLFIDELQNFLSPDVGKILDECRKFGLHMVMAHQHLAQLRIQDPVLYHSVMTDARTKVVFGGLTWDDLEILEKEVFAGTHNLKEIKDEIRQRAVVDYDIKSMLVEGGSNSSGSTLSESYLDSDAFGTTFSQMYSQTIDPTNGMVMNPVLYEMQGASSGSSSVSAHAQGRGSSFSDAETRSWSNVPMLVPVMDEVVSSRQFYSLDEERYKNIVKLKNQPTQFAYIKVLEKPPVPVKINTVVEFIRDEDKRQKLYELSCDRHRQYYLSAEQIEAEFEATEERINRLLEEGSEEPTDFRE